MISAGRAQEHFFEGWARMLLDTKLVWAVFVSMEFPIHTPLLDK